MRWSGVRISGGSPKIAMTELGRSLLFFCVRRDTEIRTGFARRSCLRAPPSKVFSPRLRTAPIRSPALLAYLRWVTKNSNDRTWTVVAIFLCPQGHRDSNGVRAAKLLARTALKSVLASSPHRPHPKPCTTRISPVGLLARPAAIDLPATNAGDADPAAARPGMHPRANAFPMTSARRTTPVKVSALSSGSQNGEYPFAAPAAVLTGGRGEW